MPINRKHNAVIRMGAAHWDVTISTPQGPLSFDLRAMDRHARGKFHGQFMSAVRKSLRQQPNRKAA